MSIFENSLSNPRVSDFFDLFDVLTSDRRQVKQKEYLERGRFPIIDQGESMIGGYLDDDSLLFTGDLPVIVFGDHTRRLKFVDFPFVVGADGTKLIRCRDSIIERFGYFHLQAVELRDRGYARHFGELRKEKFWIPSISEQERIVEILEEQFSRLDAALASVRAVRQKSERFRRSLLHAAFTGALTCHDSSDGMLPEGWKVSCLGDVAKWGSGGTPKSGTDAYYGGPIKWAVIGDLTESWVNETTQSITKLGLEKSSAKLISPGTVMLAMYGASIGRTGIAAVEMATNQAIAFAVPHDGILVADYLLKYLQSQKDDFVRAGQGGAQPNISQTVIKPWPIPLPPMDVQKKIVEILEEQFSRLDASLAIADVIEKKAFALRRSLLHAAFSGNLTKEWREGAHV